MNDPNAVPGQRRPRAYKARPNARKREPLVALVNPVADAYTALPTGKIITGDDAKAKAVALAKALHEEVKII